MGTDEVSGNRQPEPHPAVPAGHRAVDLSEHVEDERQMLGRNPGAAVANAQPELVANHVRRHDDLAAVQALLARGARV